MEGVRPKLLLSRYAARNVVVILVEGLSLSGSARHIRQYRVITFIKRRIN
jgi:hypothetical protein